MSTPTIDIRGNQRLAASTPDVRRPAADTENDNTTSLGVLLVDDDPTSSYSLSTLLRWRPGISILAITRSADAVDAVEREQPDVCLISAALGPRFIHRLAELRSAPPVIAYTGRRTPELDAIAVIAGAEAAMWRYADPDELTKTIREVAGGCSHRSEVSSEVMHRILDRVVGRDRPIAAMLLLGTPRDEIARTLGISARSLRARRWEMVRHLEQCRDHPSPVADDQRVPSGLDPCGL